MFFGLDLSDPQTQAFILQGGAVIVALAILTTIIIALINSQTNRDKLDGSRDGQQNEILKIVLTDMKTSLDRSATAQEQATEVVRELKEYIKEDHRRRDQAFMLIDNRLASVEGKVDGVIASVKILTTPGPQPHEGAAPRTMEKN